MRLFAALGLGIAVNFLWGLAFLVPYALPTVDPVLITAGRYVTYGLLSVALLVAGSGSSLRGLGRGDWLWAFALALTGNVGYYAVLVSAIRLGGVTLTSLIIGTLPVTLALYGNRSQREFEHRRLALPLGLILCGLLVLNGVSLSAARTPGARRDLVLGAGLAMVALVLWTWYGVKNAQYLKRHPRVGGPAWSTAIGVATLALTGTGLVLLGATGAWSPSAAWASLASRRAVVSYLAASLVLGVVVSWLATLLWNLAARDLPIALAGQLVVFETLSSILYSSLVNGSPPRAVELACIAVIVLGVLLGIRATRLGRSEVDAGRVAEPEGVPVGVGEGALEMWPIRPVHELERSA